MRTCLYATCLVAAIAWFGCGGKPSTSDSGANNPAPQPKSGGSVESLLGKDAATAPAAPVVPEAGTGATPTAPAAPAPAYTPRVEEAMGQMTMFVQQYEMEFKRLPSSLNDLVRPGYLPYIFPPPKGKKWVIDAKAKSVKLADQ